MRPNTFCKESKKLNNFFFFSEMRGEFAICSNVIFWNGHLKNKRMNEQETAWTMLRLLHIIIFFSESFFNSKSSMNKDIICFS